MNEQTLARRYASALLALSEKEGTVEETEANLLALKEAWKKTEPFRQALRSPKLPRATRRQLLRKPFEGKTGKSFLDFLSLLVDKKRVNLIPDIADAFDRLADTSRGVVRTQVRSWKPLDEKTRVTLREKLAKITGRKIELTEQVDPALQGGLMVQIGDSILDGTVAYRLKRLRERLLEIQRTA